MFSHVTVGANDYTRARSFYDALLAPLGIRRSAEWPDAGWASYQAQEDGQVFFIARPHDGRPAQPGNGIMPGFAAPDEQAVHAAYDAGIAAGGSCEGPPGPRPTYGGFYAAYLRDPEGNKLCVVFKMPATDGTPG